MSLERLGEVVGAVGRLLQTGARAYWVCPLIAESETVDVAAAEERFRDLAGLLGDKVDLLHGQMKGPAKDAVMARFVFPAISACWYRQR